MKRSIGILACAALLSLWAPGRALAWDWFRSPNGHVEEGNRALAEGNAEAALEAYGKAARELPDRGDVHLDRGLALSQLGRLDEAREAFDLATRGKVGSDVRADAYYNLGRTFLEQAEAQADAGDLEGSQAKLEESRDALRQSLRTRPGFEDAAWNLELVQRRLVEIEKEKEKERQKQEQEQQDQEQQDQEQGEDGEPQDQDGSEGEREPEDRDQGEDGEPQEEDGDGDEPQDQDSPQPQEEDGEQTDDETESPEPQEPDAGAEPPEPQPAQDDSQPAQGEQEALPQHVQQVLDSLQDGEETMQRHQARTRAQQRPRRVEKDW